MADEGRGLVEVTLCRAALPRGLPAGLPYVCVCVCVCVREREREREREAGLGLRQMVKKRTEGRY